MPKGAVMSARITSPPLLLFYFSATSGEAGWSTLTWPALHPAPPLAPQSAVPNPHHPAPHISPATNFVTTAIQRISFNFNNVLQSQLKYGPLKAEDLEAVMADRAI